MARGSGVKAAVCRTFGEPLTIEEVQLDPPDVGEVRVKLHACAICHSDITLMEGGWGGELPVVLGHEAAGVVAEVGPGVGDVTVGDHTVVTLIRSCGSCRYCERGGEVGCTTKWPLDEKSPITGADGERIGHGLRTAAFAEEAVVERSQIVTIDEDIPLDVAALLACGVITGHGAVSNTADVRAGDTVVVIGCGGVGLNAIQAAALSPASRVIAVDVNSSKLEAALGFGATHTINSAESDLRAEVKTITEGARADWVFVTVGAKAAYDQSYALLAPFGAVVLVGLPPGGATSTIDPTIVASLSQRILGSKMGDSRIATDIPALVDLYRSGDLQLDELITGRYPLELINEAIAEVNRGEALRNVIVFDG